MPRVSASAAGAVVEHQHGGERQPVDDDPQRLAPAAADAGERQPGHDHDGESGAPGGYAVDDDDRDAAPRRTPAYAARRTRRQPMACIGRSTAPYAVPNALRLSARDTIGESCAASIEAACSGSSRSPSCRVATARILRVPAREPGHRTRASRGILTSRYLVHAMPDTIHRHAEQGASRASRQQEQLRMPPASCTSATARSTTSASTRSTARSGCRSA